MKRIWIFSILLLTIISFTLTRVKINAEETVEDEIKEEITIPEEEQETPIIPDEPVIEEPSILETKAKEFTDWIIALVVSFLGSSAFYLIVRAILNKTIKLLKDKVAALNENKDISEESKKQYEKKIEELESTINKLIENNNELLNFVREKLEVNAEKEQKMAELLSTLLPVKEGAKND